MNDMVDFFISKFRELLNKKEPEFPQYYKPRAYRNAAVRLRSSNIKDFDDRKEELKRAGLNVFLFRSDLIPGCDLLSDSGTTTMTMEQWSQLLLGDEAYGSNEGYFKLKKQIKDTFGKDWISAKKNVQNLYIFHQGRACEYALFTTLSNTLKKIQYKKTILIEPITEDMLGELPDELKPRVKIKYNKIMAKQKDFEKKAPSFLIPSNTYFDTTEANIESSNIVPVNLPCEEYENNILDFHFKGNMNLHNLENLIKWNKERIPLIYITITNNTGGGQPVSMENIKKTSDIAKKNKIPLFFDACRFAENAWFIEKNEKGYEGKEIKEIVREMFGYIDGFHISFKKDGLVNIGGAILIKSNTIFTEKYPDFSSELTDHQILTEGHPTYGGLAGRDLMGLVEGLQTVVKKEYLDYRIGQVERFGKRLTEFKIPIVEPIGGHAVYIKMDDFFGRYKTENGEFKYDTDTKDDDFKGISFTALMLIAGHRFCELGLYAFGKCTQGIETKPDPRVNFVRGAVPRFCYEDQDLFAAAEAVKILYKNRDRIPGVKVNYGKELTLRHFKSKFEFKI